MKKTILLLPLLLCACGTYTYPVAAVSTQGQILKGTTTVNKGLFEAHGTFKVTDGKLTCSGSFSNTTSMTVTMPVLCSDGRRGFATVTCDLNGGGTGRVVLNDGSQANVVLGPAAEAF